METSNTATKRKFDSKLWLGQESLLGKTILLCRRWLYDNYPLCKIVRPECETDIQWSPLIGLVRDMGLDAEVIAPVIHQGGTITIVRWPAAFGTTIDTVPYFASICMRQMST